MDASLIKAGSIVSVEHDGKIIIRRVSRVNPNGTFKIVGINKAYTADEINPPLAVDDIVIGYIADEYSNNIKGRVIEAPDCMYDGSRITIIDENGDRYRFCCTYGTRLNFVKVSSDLTDNNDGTSYDSEMAKYLCKVGYDFDINVVRSVEKSAYEAKAELREKFKNHPNWSEKHQAIIWDYEATIEPDLLSARDLINHLIYNGSSYNSDLIRLISEIITNNICEGKVCINDQRVQRLTGLCPSFEGYHMGTKATRFFRDLLDFLGITSQADFEKSYAKIADCLSTRKIKKKAVLSINLMDFLTMSNGNSWSSCHSIENRGCYHGGTLSYALDSSTAIFYTIDTERDTSETAEPLYLQPKITRQLFMFGDDFVVQSRQYPDYHQLTLINEQGNSVMNIYKTLWNTDIEEVISSPGAVRSFVNMYTETSGVHYPDYTFDCYNCRIYIPSKKDFYEKIRIGCPAPDLTTGEINLKHDTLGTQINHLLYECADCGSLIDPNNDDEDYCCYGGEYYCNDCYVYCDDCDDRIPYRFAHSCDDHYYCDDCFDRNFTSCDCCGETINTEDAYYVDDVCYCDACLDDECSRCDHCGEYYHNDELTEVNEALYCPSCYEKRIRQCDGCGELFEIDDLYEVGDSHFCSHCRKEKGLLLNIDEETKAKFLEGDVAVIFSDYQQIKTFLEYLEEETEVKWVSGKKLTDSEVLFDIKRRISSNDTNIYIRVDNGLVYGKLGEFFNGLNIDKATFVDIMSYKNKEVEENEV